MKNIDEYINQVNSKENISDGGSAAYDFGDVVLVKYVISTKYGIARENEELVAEAANEKNKKGVNTPAHLAVKRVNEGENNVCWVLQEKVKGVSFTKYYAYNNSAQEQILLQQELLDAPDYHFEKCISDLSELFNMGLELKPKNIFYDNSKDGIGFSFIDLLEYNKTSMNSNSIVDLLKLDRMMQFICNFTTISSYDRNAIEDEKNKSLELSYSIRKKIFIIMEKVVPNFNQFRRWILRTYPKDVLDFFDKNGIYIGELSLTNEEYKQFNDYIEIIVNNCIEKIATGKNLFWEIEVNEIRIMLDEMGMRDAWNVHSSNPVKNIADFKDEWEFEDERRRSLDNLVNNLFNQKLLEIAKKSTNPFILQAKNDLEEIMIKEQNKKNKL